MVSAQKPNINRSDAVRDKVGEEGKVILKRQSEFIMLAPDHSIFRSCITFLLSLLFTLRSRRFMIFVSQMKIINQMCFCARFVLLGTTLERKISL